MSALLPAARPVVRHLCATARDIVTVAPSPAIAIVVAAAGRHRGSRIRMAEGLPWQGGQGSISGANTCVSAATTKSQGSISPPSPLLSLLPFGPAV
jgi:hypothetical protein